MSIHNSPNLPNPEVIALKALGFLAQDGERFQRFLNLTGIELAFLGGVLDHLLGDQTLLLVFAESEDIAPEQVARARRALPGAIA
jgi:hypothetical protein